MLKIKGFLNCQALTDNSAGAVSKFGELSGFGRTFARDPLEFNDSRWPDVELVVLHSRETATNAKVAPSTEFTYKTLEIMQWIYQNGTNNPTNMTTNDFRVGLLNMFQGQIENPSCGPIVTDGIRRLPEWVEWKQTSNTENSIKFWFVNESLEREFDEYEIVIVPPIPIIDNFFQSTQQVQKALALQTQVKIMEAIHVAKNKQPESVLRCEIIPFTNQTMPTGQYIDTNWHAIIYGAAGDSTENIKRAVIDHITANSTAGVNQWKIVFPDIFRTTEMFILPRWDKLAIQFRQTVSGLYSPINPVLASLNWVKGKLTALSSAHIDANLESTHHKFRSITLLAIGGTDNKEAKYRLSDYVPDYIGESATALDFNRMSEASKAWTTMMEQMLILAEEADDITTLPVDIRRTTRNDILFLSKKLGGVEYLVATKKSIAPVTP